MCYVQAELMDENGNTAPDADTLLTAQVSGEAELLGFGSGNPITDENYTKGQFTTWQGRALAVLRAGHEPGEVRLTVSAKGLAAANISLPVQP